MADPLIDKIAMRFWSLFQFNEDEAQELAKIIIEESKRVDAPPLEVAEVIVRILIGKLNE